VTVCTHGRECLFGHVVNGQMRLNDAGEIVRHCWEDIPTHFSHAVLDAFVIVPNHVRGIVAIRCRGEASDFHRSSNTRMGIDGCFAPTGNRP
jgi:putative transposase